MASIVMKASGMANFKSVMNVRGRRHVEERR